MIPADVSASKPKTHWVPGSWTEKLFPLALVCLGLWFLIRSVTLWQGVHELALEKQTATRAIDRLIQRMRSSGPVAALNEYGERRQVAVPLNDTIATEDSNLPQIHIHFYTDETVDAPRLGLPRDLDGDGQVQTKNVERANPAEIRILPVELSLTWLGRDEETHRIARHALIVRN